MWGRKIKKERERKRKMWKLRHTQKMHEMRIEMVKEDKTGTPNIMIYDSKLLN